MKDEFDLNLNEITTKEEVKPPPPAIEESKKEDVKTAGVTLVWKKGGNFFEKDMHLMTNEEFISWIKFTYPLYGELKMTEKFDNTSRQKVFATIVRFHETANFFYTKKDKDRFF